MAPFLFPYKQQFTAFLSVMQKACFYQMVIDNAVAVSEKFCSFYGDQSRIPGPGPHQPHKPLPGKDACQPVCCLHSHFLCFLPCLKSSLCPFPSFYSIPLNHAFQNQAAAEAVRIAPAFRTPFFPVFIFRFQSAVYSHRLMAACLQGFQNPAFRQKSDPGLLMAHGLRQFINRIPDPPFYGQDSLSAGRNHLFFRKIMK